MFTLDGSGVDAPLIDNQDTADLNDTYYFHHVSDEAGSDDSATGEEAFANQVMLAEDEARQASGSSVTVDLGTEDLFVFLSAGPGNGSAVPDSSTPAPEEEEPEPPTHGAENEMKDRNLARHDAMRASIRHIW